MANYYRKFVCDFSEIAYPLTRLIRKGIEFQWTEEEQKALDELKARLSSSEVMRFPDFTQPFKLYTDASLVAAGAVLCQDFPDGERPIAYYSKTLQPAWTRYCAVEREMLAILLSMRKVRFYIVGRDVSVITDCTAITHMNSIKDISNPRLYSVQPKVSIRVDGATELGVRGSQSATELMFGNSRAFAAAASDWLMSLPNSVAPSTRIETFG